MRISKLVSLMLCIFVLSCTTNDQEDVLTPHEPDVALQEPHLNIQETDFALSKEEADILDKLFVELQDNPDYFNQSIEDQMAFIALFASQYGYNVDLKDYDQYIYPDGRYETEHSLNKKTDSYVHEIDNYVFRTGIGSALPSRLDNLEQNITADPKLTEEEVLIIKSDIALWKHLSASESFVKLYHEQLGSENSRGIVDYLKCTAYGLKFGVTFYLCITGKPTSCLKLPAEVLSAIEQCKVIFKSKPPIVPCAGSTDPCCLVNCRAGYICNGAGSCVKDSGYNPPPCTDCSADEECINGVCQRF